jgi:16S rRNA (guanine527-N7)-methyltransferase
MEKFSKSYYDMLVGEYAGINLTRIVDYGEFWVKQILDSLEAYKQSPVFQKEILENRFHIDIGFGGGFPILPLAKFLPEVQFCGIETRAKKVKVVSEISTKLGITNAKFIHSRIEDVLIDKTATISLKAVGKVHDFLNKINTTKTVTVFFYKGPNFYDLEQEQMTKSLIDWDLVEEREILLEGVEKRYLIGFRNKKVLRGTENKMTKNLVKLSDLL